MSREETINCDNPDCNGCDDHYYRCNGGHDICSICLDRVIVDDKWKYDKKTIKGDDVDGIWVCPICFAKSKLVE